MEVCLKHVNAVPESPSARCGRPINPALQALLLRCLAKSRSGRPADAADLLRQLEGCDVQGRWTAADAASWWAAHDQPQANVQRTPAAVPHGESPPVAPENVATIYKGD
jgi:serine/threonine-protein kinase